MAKAAEPWDKSNPRKKAGKVSKKLTPAKKAAAKASAKKAGRPYPNLVDNMRAASKKTTSKKSNTKKSAKVAKKSTKTRATKKRTTTKKVTKKATKKGASSRPRATTDARTKDPKGGLTAAGRRAFERKDGSHLKKGVTKSDADMTPEDMKRKGSWAVRFYGRDPLPPLIDKAGNPTRLALSAHAWGEPVPKTAAAARKIAAKGHKLLERYNKFKSHH